MICLLIIQVLKLTAVPIEVPFTVISNTDFTMASDSSSDESFHGFPPEVAPRGNANTDFSDIEVSSASSSSNSDTESLTDFDFIEPRWTKDSSKFTGVHCDAFNKPEGHNLHQNFDIKKATPMHYFQLYFTNEMFANIVQNTNKLHCSKLRKRN